MLKTLTKYWNIGFQDTRRETSQNSDHWGQKEVKRSPATAPWQVTQAKGWASELDTKLRFQTDQHYKSSKLTDCKGTVGIQTVPLLRNQSLCVRRVLKTSEEYTVAPSVPTWQGIPTLAKSQTDLNPEVQKQWNLPNKAKRQNSKVYWIL